MIPTHSSEKTKKMGLVVNHLGQLSEYDFTKPHRHDYFEFFYFQKGGGTHTVDFIDFPIYNNSIHIVAPGQVHQMRRALDSEGHVLLFELSAIQAPLEIENFLFEHICLNAEELNPIFKLSDDDFKVNIKNIESIYESFTRGAELDRLKLQNGLHKFCIDCMELSQKSKYVINTDYLQFRKFLRTNFKGLKKVKDYANLMHISERSLNDLVKENSGKSASEVIYHQVIMEAKRLLRTGITIKEVAYALSFDDPAHFSKFFKSKTKQTPKEFQNNT